MYTNRNNYLKWQFKIYLVSSKYSSISALGQSSSAMQGPLVLNLINPGLQKHAYPQWYADKLHV